MITNKRIQLILIITTVFIKKTNAQMSIGLDEGITFNRLSYKSIDPNVLLTREPGYITSIPLQYQFNKWLIIEAAPGLIQKNYSVQNKSEVYQKVKNQYLQFPVSAKYLIRLTPKIVGYGSFGIYYAYWLNSKAEGSAPNVFDIEQTSQPGSEQLIKLEKIKYSIDLNSKQYNRSEYGWLVKAGLGFSVNKNITLSIKGHFYQAVTDQQQKTVDRQGARYNETIAVTLGPIFHLR